MPETAAPPMCPGCSERDRVVRGQYDADKPADDLSTWWCNRCCAWLSAATRRRGRHTADFDVPLNRPARDSELRRKAAEQVAVAKAEAEASQAVADAPKLAPIDYWQHPTRLALELQDDTKVSADWEPSSQTLRLHGPFGAVVERPFLRTDNASLHSCALARAEKAWLDHRMRFLSAPDDEIGLPPGTGRGLCDSCRAPIFWAVTAAGKKMPLDAEPVADGNVVLIDGRAKVLTKKQLAGGGITVPRYTPHHATCPQGRQWRKK